MRWGCLANEKVLENQNPLSCKYRFLLVVDVCAPLY